MSRRYIMETDAGSRGELLRLRNEDNLRYGLPKPADRRGSGCPPHPFGQTVHRLAIYHGDTESALEIDEDFETRSGYNGRKLDNLPENFRGNSLQETERGRSVTNPRGQNPSNPRPNGNQRSQTGRGRNQ